MSSKQGFGSLTPEDRLKIARKGGQAKVPKGVSSLPPEERTRRAREAAEARWKKYREQKAKEHETDV